MSITEAEFEALKTRRKVVSQTNIEKLVADSWTAKTSDGWIINTNVIKKTLPYPPSSNRYWRKTNRGVVYLSAEAKLYKKMVAIGCRKNLVAGAIALTLRFYRPRKTGDLSNRIKVLEDALQGIFYDDDKQIVRIVAERFEDKSNPRVEIEIRAVLENEFLR